MQNPIAPLLPIATVTEAMSPVLPADTGDGSFSDAFIDVDIPSEPLSKPEEAVSFALFAPFAWGELLLATPASPPATDLGLASGSDGLSTEGVAGDVQLSLFAPTDPVASDPSPLQPVPPYLAAVLPSSSDGSSVTMPIIESGKRPGLRVAEGKLPETGAFAETAPDTASDASVSEAPKAIPALGSGLASVSQEDGPKKGSLTFGKQIAAHDEKHPQKAAPRLAVPEIQQTWLEGPPSGAIFLQMLPDVAIENGKGLANRPVAIDPRVTLVDAGSPLPKPVVGEMASWSVVETLQDPEPLPTLPGQDLGNPKALLAEAHGATPSLTEPEEQPLFHDQPTALPWDQDIDSDSPVVSFWERFFSDRTTALAGTQSQSVLPSAVGITSPGPVLIEVGSGARSDLDREHPSGNEPSAKSHGPDQPPGLAMPAAVAWAREMLDDILSKALPQLSFADWQGDFSIPDPRPEGSISSLPVHSAGPAHGSPGAPVAGPHFPIPHIASQLASVLVRNDSGTTELALAPEELGKVRLRMEPDSANPDRMVIVISVERPETLDLFRRHAGDLAEAIRSAGYSGADIGFGQNSQDSGTGHRKDSSHTGPGIPFEEIGPVETARPHTIGASLDLRL